MRLKKTCERWCERYWRGGRLAKGVGIAPTWERTKGSMLPVFRVLVEEVREGEERELGVVGRRRKRPFARSVQAMLVREGGRRWRGSE